MANLLPDDARHALLQMLSARFALGAACMLTFGVCAFSLSLLPAYTALRAEREVLILSLGARGESSGERKDRSEALRVKQVLEQLSFLSSGTSTIEFVSAALSVKPHGISVDNITWSVERGLMLSGVAQNRDAVGAYREALLADKDHFSAVSVPVSSFIGSEDRRFTVTLTPVR